ncbi:MAG: Maf-like protein [Bacteroidales bacterium]|nr:Maf-like protein [Bacteroidales bacterium]
MFENLQKYHVVLASNSPRRKELLANLGIKFDVRTLHGIDESYPPELVGEEVALHIVGKKAAAYQATMAPDELVVTADTIVCVDERVLGKPADADDARAMLRMLSGRQHHVVTAVGITTADRTRTFAVTTEVTFAQLSDEVIDHYIEVYRPYDKAGAYGIQEWIGHVGVKSINGSFFNVMGLPVQRLFQELQKIN